MPSTPWPSHYSQETLEYHHGKHHNAYVVNLNNLQEGHRIRSDGAGRHHQEVQRRHLQQRRPDLEPHLLLELHGPRAVVNLAARWLRHQRQVWPVRRFQEAFVKSAGGQFWLGLDLAGEKP